MATKNALESFRETNEASKNKAADEITGNLKETALSVGEELKGKFNIGGVLDKFNSLLDSVKNLPLGDKFSAILSSLLNSQLNKLKNAVNETIASGWKALTHMADMAINKMFSVALSHLSLPDEVYLAGIKSLYAIGANLRYREDYARKTAIKYDYPKSLKWIDETIGFKYSILENRSKTKSTLSTITRYCCRKNYCYIFDILKAEDRIFISNINSYKAQINDKNSMINGIQNKIKTLQDELDVCEDPIRIEELEVLIGLEEKNIEQVKKEIDSLQEELDIWEDKHYDYESLLAETFKNLLVNSVGYLSTDDVQSITKNYGIIPAWYGSTDPKFNNRFMISSSDVNVMAPFYKGSGFNSDIQSTLGDTRLVQTSKLTKYILPRNTFIKYIYVLLNNQNIYGYQNQLVNQELYERLKYPTMDLLSQMGDEALGMMIEDGLGRMAIDALLAIERSIYDFTKVSEPSMVLPISKEYFQMMSYGQNIPAPIYPPTYTDNSTNKYPGSNPWSENMRQSDLNAMLNYYFKALETHEAYVKVAVNLYNLLKAEKDKVSSDDNKTEFWNIFLKNYIHPDVLKPSFNIEEFYKVETIETIRKLHNTIMIEIYFQFYHDLYDKLPDMNEYDTILVKVFENQFMYLKNAGFTAMLDKMTDDEVLASLLVIYNFIGEEIIRTSNQDVANELLKFIRKHYSEKAYTTDYHIKTWLFAKTAEERRSLLKTIIADLEQEMLKNPIFTKLKESLFDKIYVQIFPIYGTVIKVEAGTDIDIDDETIKEYIENNYNDNLLSQIFLKDFDNKTWMDDYKDPSHLDVLNDRTFKPNEALGYVIFYNPDITE